MEQYTKEYLSTMASMIEIVSEGLHKEFKEIGEKSRP
jgi:hypothetical protein